MRTVTALSVVMMVCLLVGTSGRTASPTKTPDTTNQPFEIGNRDEPDLDQLHVITKSFLVGMRRHHGDKNANALRAYFDPRYLKKHNLTERDLSAELAAVWGIHTYQVADDRRTVLCIVETKEKPDQAPVKEAILLQLTVHEKKLYVAPVKDPDPKTGRFTPWILRMKL